MPFIVRIGGRARKALATEWEKQNQHPFFLPSNCPQRLKTRFTRVFFCLRDFQNEHNKHGMSLPHPRSSQQKHQASTSTSIFRTAPDLGPLTGGTVHSRPCFFSFSGLGIAIITTEKEGGGHTFSTRISVRRGKSSDSNLDAERTH